MTKKLSYFFLAVILFTSCSKTSLLQKAETLLSPNESSNTLKFKFEEELNELGHLSKPWATSTYTGKGDFWLGNNLFLKQDTLISSRVRSYTSQTDYRDNTLLYLDYGDDELLPLTENLYFEKLINTARYSPQTVLEFFLNSSNEVTAKSKGTATSYSLEIGKFPVELCVHTNSGQVDEISYVSYDELYGDITTTFKYSAYKTSNGTQYPSEILIEKINGKVVDKVSVLAVEPAGSAIKLLDKPNDYQLIPEPEETQAKITVTKYNERINFIDLEHTDDRVLVVEFDSYMLVAEAPLSPKNGELIIEEVKKIAPEKPIKYFVFGHHHPHYLGGLRAFVHKEATILCTEMSKSYVEYIVNAPHTLQPDNLELEPANLSTQVVNDSLIIGDANEMKVYFIGEKSAHTYDYLIYYFPKEKLLFQDDLCWISKEGPIKKAGSRQVGLYNSILELNLDVETIIQSWPVTNHKVKTVIPFADLKASVLLTE